MMAKWTKILPFFLVEIISRQICERTDINGKIYSLPYRGVLIWIKSDKANAKIDTNFSSLYIK